MDPEKTAMTKSRNSLPWAALWFVCLATLALGCDADRSAAPPGARPAMLTRVSEEAAPAEEAYVNPKDLTKHFAGELTRLLKEEKVVAPAELADQEEQAGTCEVETLPDPGRKLSPEEIYARARHSVVIVGAIVKRGKGHEAHAFCATGFVVHGDGLIVTDYHVLTSFREAKALGVMTDDGRVFAVEAVPAADKHNDLVLLKVGARGLAALPVAGQAPVGAAVYCLSHPMLNAEKTANGFYTFTSGIVSGKFHAPAAKKAAVDVLTITADYAVGSSGAPVLNEHGAVVAVACETLPIFHEDAQKDVQMIWKYCRPSSSLLSLLRASPPKKL
jgi:S1-C subfamily serine protease